ncbi:MAG: BrnT family toxin [Pseudomonadota bacterium]
MTIAGFNWDEGNWPKCNKHGVTKEEIEEIFSLSPKIMSDPHPYETRIRAIGRTYSGRYIFLVFTFRDIGNQRFIRPISARYMHQKEIDHYEQSAS